MNKHALEEKLYQMYLKYGHLIESCMRDVERVVVKQSLIRKILITMTDKNKDTNRFAQLNERNDTLTSLCADFKLMLKLMDLSLPDSREKIIQSTLKVNSNNPFKVVYESFYMDLRRIFTRIGMVYDELKKEVVQFSEKYYGPLPPKIAVYL